FSEKLADTIRDFGTMCLQRKMSRIEHVGLDLFQIAAIRRSTLRRENKIVLSPDDERRWLEVAKELLKSRIQRHIGTVVIKQIELDFVISWPIKAKLVQHPRSGIQQARILYAILVLPLCRLRVHQETECLAILVSWLIPIF